MNIYIPTRDAIYGKLLSVEGIGRVFPHLRFVSDWEKLLELYTVPHPMKLTLRLPCVTWLTRVAQPAAPSWAADENIADIRYTSNWRITLLYGLADDENPEFSSETAFQRLVDRIVETFSLDHTLGGAEGVERTWPIEVISSVPSESEGGGILCHRAEMLLRVEHVVFE